VVEFYSKRIDSAKFYFGEAKSKLDGLQIDETALVTLCSMGFTTSEARIALRTNGGQIQKATDYAITKKEEKQQRRKEELRLQQAKREIVKLGKTNNGKLVDTKILEDLMAMGFNKELVVEALRQTNNDNLQTVKLLLESPNILQQSIESRRLEKLKKNTIASSTNTQQIDPQQLEQLSTVGFTNVEMCTAVLRHVKNDINRALAILLDGGAELNTILQQATESATLPTAPSLPTVPIDSQNTAVPQEVQSPVDVPMGDQNLFDADNDFERQIEEELLPDISNDAEAYLDLTLEEETSILNEYFQLLTTNTH